jgi:hypothetical protein
MKKPIQVKITSGMIKETKAFQELPKTQQHFIVKRSGRLSIQNAVNVSLNIGFDEFIKKTPIRWTKLCIIEELTKKHKINN